MSYRTCGLQCLQEPFSHLLISYTFFVLLATEKFDLLKVPPNKRLCGGCGCPINDRFLLKALDRFWHEDCLKCGCCECRLGEVGSTLYTKANLILCRRDYLRLVLSNVLSQLYVCSRDLRYLTLSSFQSQTHIFSLYFIWLTMTDSLKTLVGTSN